MNVLTLAWRYKELLLIAFLFVSVGYYKSRYESSVQALNDYKLAKKVLYDAAVTHNKKMKENADKALEEVITNHKKQLAGLNLDRVREANKLKGSINEISDSLNIYRDAIGLRNESTSYNAMPKVPETTEGITEAWRNCNAQLTTVIDACKVTDYDYEALYNAWDRTCLIHGCE